MSVLDTEFVRAISAGIEWSLAEMAPKGARAFTGAGSGWHFVVVSFDIEDQGFPAGSRGYDGTARRGTVILHLDRAQAELLCTDAEEKTAS